MRSNRFDYWIIREFLFGTFFSFANPCIKCLPFCGIVGKHPEEGKIIN
jgi:hypothetical protein